MSDEYTPTTEQVREAYAGWHGETSDGDVGIPWADSEAAFDRWLAAHEVEVRERIAQGIEADMNHDVTRNATLTAAARIARGAAR